MRLVACVPSRAAVTSFGQPIQVAPDAALIMPRTSNVTVSCGHPCSATAPVTKATRRGMKKEIGRT